MFFRSRKAQAQADPVVAELSERLSSLHENCLAGLERGLAAMADGDLTVAVQPVTTPISTTARDPEVQALVETFNAMLQRTQNALGAFDAMREDMREALGDHSCLHDLRDRLKSLDGHCLTNLKAGVDAMVEGDLTVDVQPATKPLEAKPGEHVGELAEIFNGMLGRAQSALVSYNTVREDLRSALGDHSCLHDLRDRLRSLDGHCLTNLKAGVDAMAEGDLTVRVDPRTTPIESQPGENVGELAEIFNSMLGRAQSALVSYNAAREELRGALGDQSCLGDLRDRLNSLNSVCLTNLETGLKAMSERGDLTVEVHPATKPLAGEPGANIGELAEIFNGMLGRAQTSLEAYNVMREDLAEVAGAVGRVAEGDLTVAVDPKSEDDMLGIAVSTMAAQLGDLVGQVADLAVQLAAASQQMASSSDEAGRAIGEIAHAVTEVATGAERQVRTIESARRMTEEVAAATQESASSAEEATAAAKQASEVAAEGASAVEQATTAMETVRETSTEASSAMTDLARKSEQIGGIVDTITNIAEQTNLLALNAAIEAARAGEQGRGFAVVADEVRTLAEESQSAAATIGELVREIQAETRRASDAVQSGATRTAETAGTVEQARASFMRIGTAVEDMSARVTAIASAMQQIAGSSAQMQHDMSDVAAVAEQSSASAQQVSASTEETTASAQEIAASAAELARRAESLSDLVGRFQLATA